MRFDRFTTKAQEVVSLAMEEANRRGKSDSGCGASCVGDLKRR